jgi:hypothetical protein
MASLWQSINIYYYDTHKDDLLLDCVRPLIQTLKAYNWVERIHFIRHWNGGPHIRLQIFTSAALFQKQVVPFVTGEISTYLAQKPSTSRLLMSRPQPRAMKNTDSRTIRPDNSIFVQAYEGVSLTIGSPSAARMLEDYYEDTEVLAFEILEQTRNNYTGRFNACFDQLVALVATSPFLPLGSAYMSYRSHVEGFILKGPPHEDSWVRRQRLECAYQERQEVIEKRLQLLLALITKEPQRLSPWLSSMIAMHRHYGERAFQGAQDGTVRLQMHDGEILDDEWLAVGPSMEAIAKNQSVLHDIGTPTTIAHRIGLHFLYLNLHRIGLLNEDRSILLYYIVRAVEELMNVGAAALMRA